MRRRQLLSLSASGVAVSLAGCFGNPDAGRTPTEETDLPAASEAIEIVSSEIERDKEDTFAETVRIRGRAKNNSEHDIPNVQFIGRYFDENGDPLQENVEDYGRITKGNTVSFEIGYQGNGSEAQKVDSHEVEVGQDFETE